MSKNPCAAIQAAQFCPSAIDMNFMLEPLFNLFGKRAIGQLVGGVVIGALMPLLTFWRNRERPPGGYVGWTICGAIAGFIGGLFLLSPKRFFGCLFALLGIALVAIPMSHADGTPTTAREYAIKIGIGLAFTLLGGGMWVRAWRRLK